VGDLRRRRIELGILGAVSALQQGDRAEAAASLSQALGSAEPDDYRRAFLDDGVELLPLFRELRGQRPADADWSTAYLDRLLAELGDELPKGEAVPARPEPDDALIDPLTDRELEVLELLAEGLTNRQLAERLYLSVGTIKRHTHNIYGKLGVNSRTQAIIRGQNLRLLD
jgi:LuxR family maltose regulon positive regulatory protein